MLVGDAPTFVPIGSQAVELGSPLHVIVDAADADGGPLTTTVSVADPALVEAVVLTGNRSLRLTVEGFGDMVFQLFEDRAPRASGRVIGLAEEGFYEGVLFHRVDSDFVIQAGIAAGTANDGSGLGAFDDEFHPDLQHNREGILSFAKSTDDTNDSQFFVTETDARFLDFNHSIFGQLVEGFDVREAISQTPIIGGGNERPLSDVVITSAIVFTDTENSLVMLRALSPDVQTSVTVTVTDVEGNATSETFDVDTTDDLVNANPYLLPFDSPIAATTGQTASLDLRAIDLEGDAVVFAGQFTGDDLGSTATLNGQTGRLEVTAAEGFVGSIELLVGVTDTSGRGVFDTQAVTVQFLPTYINPLDRFDVDGNGAVTALDALLVINALGRGGGTIDLPNLELSTGDGSTLRSDFFYNVSGDTSISALDALQVINELGRRRGSVPPPAEAEAVDVVMRWIVAFDDDDDDARLLHSGSVR